MTARWGTLVVPINEDNQAFWYAFKTKCRDLGIPYTRAMRQAAGAWMAERNGPLTGPQPVAPATDPQPVAWLGCTEPVAWLGCTEPVAEPEPLRWEEPLYVTPPGGNPFA